MEVSKIETFLTVAGRNLDRNFSFRITNGPNSVQKAASVSIKRAYQEANDIRVSAGDKLYLSMAVNGGDKVLLFAGIVSSVGETSAYYTIEAVFDALKADTINETYRGISYKEGFAKLADKLEYRAEDASPEQIVLQGAPADSFKRLINSLSKALKKPVYYYLKRDNTLVITMEIGSSHGGAEYAIDNMLFTVGGEKVTMFPIPELEIGDTLRWGGQKKTVRGLVWDTTGRAEMESNVMEYTPPKPKTEPKKTPAQTYKPALEESDYFVNPEKLEELAPDAKQKILNLAKAVKEEMGEEFVKIYITSVQRTVDSQVEIFMKKLERKSGSQNMFEYYDENIDEAYVGNSQTVNYLNALQARFDGILPNPVRWEKIPEGHQKEINAVQKGDREKVRELLLEYTGSAFQPSSHMHNPSAVADLRTMGDHAATARKILEYNKERLKGTKIKYGYEAKTKGEPHVHINLIEPR